MNKSTESIPNEKAFVKVTDGLSISKIFREFVKGLTFLSGVYMLGAYGCSPSWLVLAVTGWLIRRNFLKEKEFRIATHHAAAMDEKGCILARLEDLPSWVFFPDTERAEWLNKILRQVWPYVGDYAKDLIKETVEPTIRESLPTYLQSFKFEKVHLGYCPPRIGGIKVYQENVSRNEIILDMELLYSGDCDFVVKVKGFRAGIRNFQIYGVLRVVLKPLVKQIPLVGAVTVYFLTNPSIDFNLTKMADVLDMPGLSDLLRKAILDQLASLMVLPNKFPVQLIQDLSAKAMKFVMPVGVLQVEIVAARDLTKADVGVLGMGKSDPYCIISVGAQEFRTPVIKNTINPKWHYTFEAVVNESHGMTLDIEVYDEDQNTKDDFLGRLSILISKMVNKKNNDMWLELEDIKTGELNIRTTWLSLSSDPTDFTPPLIERKLTMQKFTPSTTLLLVFLDSAKNLPRAWKGHGQEPSPQAHLSVGSTRFTSLLLTNTTEPVWEENFQFLLTSPDIQELQLEIVDNKTGKGVGNLSIPLVRLLKEPEMTLDQPFGLQGGLAHNAKVFLSLQLLILKDSGQDRSPQLAKESPKLTKVTASQVEVDSRSNGGSPASRGTIPSLDEMVRSTVDPILDTSELTDTLRELAPPASPITKTPSPQSSISDLSAILPPSSQLPRVQLTLRCSSARNKLVVVVHRIADLGKAGEESPDPYVKLQLLPEGTTKDGKQKTRICKDSCNPIFDETIQFELNPLEVKHHQLEIKACSRRSGSVFSRSNILGRTMLDLANLDVSRPTTDWYELEPAD